MSDQTTPDTKPAQDRKPAAAKRWRRVAIAVALVLVLSFALLPWIVAATPLRNMLVNWALVDPDLHVTIGGVSLGWFSPLTIDRLSVDSIQDESAVRVRRIRADRSWLRLWMSAPELGAIQIDQPLVSLIWSDQAGLSPALTDLPRLTDPDAPSPPTTLTASVTDAAIVIRARQRSEPAIDISGLNVTARLHSGPFGRELVIDPTTLFDHQMLTPELCRGGLQLVAPALANATDVAGEVSFRLDRCFVPLDDPDQGRAAQRAEIDGVLALHQATGDLRSPAFNQVLDLVSRVLNRPIPRSIRVADNTEVAFQLREGRFYHEGLACVLPELSPDFVLKTSGSVGLDESLDVLVQVAIPLTMIHDGPLSRKLSERPFRLHVTGTLDQPQVGLPQDRGWLRDLADVFLSDEPLGPQEQALADSLASVLGNLLSEAGDRQAGTPLLERIEARRRARAERRSAAPGTEESRGAPLRDALRGAGSPTDERPTDTEPQPAASILERMRERRQRRLEEQNEAGEPDEPGEPSDETVPRAPRRRLLNRFRSRRQPTDDPDISLEGGS